MYFMSHNVQIIIGVLVLLILIVALGCVIAFVNQPGNGGDCNDGGCDFDNDCDNNPFSNDNSMLGSMHDCSHNLSTSEFDNHNDCKSSTEYKKPKHGGKKHK